VVIVSPCTCVAEFYDRTSNDRPEALPARVQSGIAEQAQMIWMPISDYRQLWARG